MFSEHETMSEQAKSLYALPTFDLWLSRRPEGGQGFWVLSESTASLNMTEVIIIAAFTFTTSDGMFKPAVFISSVANVSRYASSL